MKMEIIEHPAIRISAYVLAISLLSLVLQATVPILGQHLIMPVFVPLFLLNLMFPGGVEFVVYLDVDEGSTAAFLLRGLITGLFWGGCVAFPLDMYQRTKSKKYRIAAIAFGTYALLVLLVAAVFFLMLDNSGWGD
jgi:hypothetical protein